MAALTLTLALEHLLTASRGMYSFCNQYCERPTLRQETFVWKEWRKIRAIVA